MIRMETTLNVKGMTCKHCEASVKGALERLQGIDKVDVNLDLGEVHVTYKEDEVTIDTMKNAIEDQGYDVE